MAEKLSLICCVNNKNAIGRDGKLIYHIKNDLKNFKRLTSGNVVIMGRKTFESLPKRQPLSDRVNIILTSDVNFAIPYSESQDVYIVHSWDEAFDLCKAFFSDKELFVIGGASLYSTALQSEWVNKVYLTQVNDDADGDAYLTHFNKKDWVMRYTASQTEEVTYSFSVYHKK